MGDPFGLQTSKRSRQQAADGVTPTNVDTALGAMKIGTMLSPLRVEIKSTVVGGIKTLDITTAVASATNGYTIVTGSGLGALAGDPSVPPLPPILKVTKCRVVGAGGDNKPGTYTEVDAGGTAFDAGAALVGVFTVSDDGKTITFNSKWTDLILEYIPRPASDMSAAEDNLDAEPT